jgi:hypothetical protein
MEAKSTVVLLYVALFANVSFDDAKHGQVFRTTVDFTFDLSIKVDSGA